MAQKDKKSIKSKLIDYAIPFFLLGLALGASYFIINNTEIMNHSFLSSIDNIFYTQNDHKDRSQSFEMGLKRDPSGKIYFHTINNNSITIPPLYYDTVKQAIIDFSYKEKDKYSYKHPQKYRELWDYSSYYGYYTALYSFIIGKLADRINNEFVSSLLKMTSKYGTKIAERENKLTLVSNQLYESRLNFEINKLKYQEATRNWKNIWIKFFECSKNITPDYCPVNYSEISREFTNLNNAYIDYRNAATTYKETSKKLIPEALNLYDSLQNEEGTSFMMMLDTIKACEDVPLNFKELIINFGNEVIKLKDKIRLEKISIMETEATIAINNPNISEKFYYFDSLDIRINENRVSRIDCLASCFYNAKPDCKTICH